MGLEPGSPEWKAAEGAWDLFNMNLHPNSAAGEWFLYMLKVKAKAEQAFKVQKLSKYPQFAGLKPNSPEWLATEAAWGALFVKLAPNSPEWDAAKKFMELSKDVAKKSWHARQVLPRVPAPGAPARPTTLLPDANEAELRRLAQLVVTDPVKAVAMGSALAQQRYLKDAMDESRPTGLQEQLEAGASRPLVEAFQAPLPSGALDPVALTLSPHSGQGYSGAVGAAAPLMQRFGLTLPEVFAIWTFTQKDYTYINPATAGDDDWMKGQFEGRDKAGRAPLHDEGRLHGGVLMQALSKLPPQTGTTYRGARVTEQGFATRYKPGSLGRLKSFLSTSSSLQSAEKFAHNSNNTNKDPNADVSVMATYKITYAFDIEPFSSHKDEKEWLLAPGTEFQEVKRVQKPDGILGRNPTATRWWEIEYVQSRVPPRGQPGGLAAQRPVPRGFQRNR